MSTWTDRVRAHPVWQQLETLGPAADQGLDREDLTPTAQAGLGRIKTVVGFTGKRLSAADSLLIQPAALDNLASSLQALLKSSPSRLVVSRRRHWCRRQGLERRQLGDRLGERGDHHTPPRHPASTPPNLTPIVGSISTAALVAPSPGLTKILLNPSTGATGAGTALVVSSRIRCNPHRYGLH